jgi:hypothetical protein
LWDEHSAEARKIATCIVGFEDAADIIGEAFMWMLHRKDYLPPGDGALLGHLRVITRGLARRAWQRRRRLVFVAEDVLVGLHAQSVARERGRRLLPVRPRRWKPDVDVAD